MKGKSPFWFDRRADSHICISWLMKVSMFLLAILLIRVLFAPPDAPINTLMHLNLTAVVTHMPPPRRRLKRSVYSAVRRDGSARAASVMRDVCRHHAGLICMCEEVWANGADLVWGHRIGGFGGERGGLPD